MSGYERLYCDECLMENWRETKTMPFTCQKLNNTCIYIKAPRRAPMEFWDSLYTELKELDLNKDNQNYDTVRVPMNRKYISESAMEFYKFEERE